MGKVIGWGSIGLLVLIIWAARSKDDAPAVQHAAVAPAAVARPSNAEVLKHEESRDEPRTFAADLDGQTERILAEFDKVDGNPIEAERYAAVLRESLGNAETIHYAHLKKNAAKYGGRPWAFTGRILQIIEQGGTTIARLQVLHGDDDYSDDVIFIEAPFETEFLVKNRIDVVGYLAGTKEYTSQAGWNIEVPALAAISMTKPGQLTKYMRAYIARAAQAAKEARAAEPTQPHEKAGTPREHTQAEAVPVPDAPPIAAAPAPRPKPRRRQSTEMFDTLD